MTSFHFTATTSAQLSKQIDKAAVLLSDGFIVNYGREGNRPSWWIHSKHGANLTTGLSFPDLVKEIQRRFDAAADFEEC
jgi:hypothetical protein